MMRAIPALALALPFSNSRSAAAHVPGAAPVDSGWVWSSDPLVLVPLLLLTVGYAAGVARLWRRAGPGRGVSVPRALAFVAGLAILFVALVSPVDAAGEASFALHMVQHMLLIVAAPPLMALGSGGVVLLTALPDALRRPVGRAFSSPLLLGPRRLLFGVPVATALHGVTIWLWHAPGLYEAALEDRLVHWLEHVTMLATAMMFWWAVINAARIPPLGHGAGVAALFLTMIHTGLLGILILLAPAPLYPTYAAGVPFGLTPLEDQQLAGIAMLLPGGIAYLAGGLALLAAWLAAAERRHLLATASRRS